MYDEFGNYIGPDINLEGSDDEDNNGVRSKYCFNGISV